MDLVATWPESMDELVAEQLALAREEPPPWSPSADMLVAGCFVCFQRGKVGAGARGDRGWAAAAAAGEVAVVDGGAGAPYEAGLLALREGPLLEAAIRALPNLRPDVVLVDATGGDHPRGAGLALQLGAVVGVPTIGVTHRALVATGAWPADERAARAPLSLDGQLVGYWLRTRPGTRPLAVHAAWRTSAETAADVVIGCIGDLRTPEPLRSARTAARTARTSAHS